MIDISLHAIGREMTVKVRTSISDENVRWLKLDVGDGGVAVFADNSQLAQIRDTISEYLDKREAQASA
jgi:hypothetical protein